MMDNLTDLVNQLRATLGKMEVALSAIVEAIVWTDEVGRIHWSNATFDRLVNRQRFQVLGNSLFDLLPLQQQGQDIDRELHPLSMTLNGQNRVNGVYEFQQGNKTFVLETSSTRIQVQGQQACAVVVIRDITKAQMAQERQTMQFAVTRILAESTTLSGAIPKLIEAICSLTGWELGALWRFDPNNNFLRWEGSWHSPNLEAADFEGISRETTFTPGIGLPGRVWASRQPAWITDVVTDSNFPRAPGAASSKLHGAFAFPILNGTEVTGIMEFFSRCPKAPDEDLLWLMVDIGSQINQFLERKRAEADLYKEQKFLNAVLNTVEAGIIACNPAGEITLFNQAALELHGTFSPPKTAVQWAQNYDFYLPNSQIKIKLEENPLLRGLRGEQLSNYEIMILPHHGTARTFLTSVQPIFEPDGNNLGAVVALHDITERKMAETQRAQLLVEQAARVEAEAAQQRIENILESITDAFIALDTQWRYTYLNPEAKQFFLLMQRNPEELIGKNIWEEFPETVGDKLEREYHRAVAEQVTVNFEEFVPALNRWYEAHAYPSPEGLSIYMRDITEQKRSEEERAQLLVREQAARKEAETANRLKDEFLATLSHELRTPLNAMLGWTQLLRTRKFNEVTIARALETIDRNTKSLAKLVEDVLDVSRIITGKLRLSTYPVELVPVIEDAIAAVRSAADAKDIRIECIFDPAAGSVLGDPNRLQQVVWNLLSNAIKFTPKNGRVEIQLTQINSIVQIRVSDTGIGIGTEFLPYVFEHFRQADSSIARSQGGLGLGLAIVRHLVELHGGTVSAASLGEGKGATFCVNLPVLAAAIQPGEPEPIDTPVASFEPLDNPLILNDLRVLVVDDEADARELIATILQQHRAEVVAVASAAEALEVLEQFKPHVLVSDIGMPFEDGYQFIRKVRAIDANRGGQTPAVALTAYARESDRAAAELAGFQRHIPKPVEPDFLVAVVANLVGRCV
ncbi:MAG: PAS domain-containing protein [Aphanothece sp. CMT-3BRIN-NPC111]|jgi:PAS domain S-box-containing protein|nr:PAS domain-containing protein [Aphanothece sp. CMT-3BRIN-NPC111]